MLEWLYQEHQKLDGLHRWLARQFPHAIPFARLTSTHLLVCLAVHTHRTCRHRSRPAPPYLWIFGFPSNTCCTISLQQEPLQTSRSQPNIRYWNWSSADPGNPKLFYYTPCLFHRNHFSHSERCLAYWRKLT
jgi:hypothetical protein